jgi:hypothetical protein
LNSIPALSKKKQPKTRPGLLSLVKQPKTVEPAINFYKLNPAWRIGRLEMRDPFGWHEIEKEKLDEIRQKLASLENSTWNDLLLIAKKQNHSIPVEDLDAAAQRRLHELGLDDIDAVISLRFSGKERVFGIPYNVALSLLWWDPDHLVCPSELKHT